VHLPGNAGNLGLFCAVTFRTSQLGALGASFAHDCWEKECVPNQWRIGHAPPDTNKPSGFHNFWELPLGAGWGLFRFELWPIRWGAGFDVGIIARQTVGCLSTRVPYQGGGLTCLPASAALKPWPTSPLGQGFALFGSTSAVFHLLAVDARQPALFVDQFRCPALVPSRGW